MSLRPRPPGCWIKFVCKDWGHLGFWGPGSKRRPSLSLREPGKGVGLPRQARQQPVSVLHLH